MNKKEDEYREGTHRAAVVVGGVDGGVLERLAAGLHAVSQPRRLRPGSRQRAGRCARHSQDDCSASVD